MNTCLLTPTALAGLWAIAAPAAASPPAWTARCEDAEVTIFASAPVPRRTVLELDEPVERAYQRAAAVVLTTDRATLERGDQLALIARHASLPGSESLADRIGPELRARLEEALARSGGDAAALDRLEPVVAAANVRVLDLARLDFFDHEEIEFYFSLRARRDRKELLALGASGDAMARGAALPAGAQRDLLDEAIRGSARADERVPALHAAWERGDVEAIEREAGRLGPRHDALRRAESERVATELVARLDGSGPWFAVVGAEYLVGAGGVLERLEARGCALRRLAAGSAS